MGDYLITGVRTFEAVRYSKDKEKLKHIMEQKQEAYRRIDSDTKDMLEIVANVKLPERFKKVKEGEKMKPMKR